MFQDAGESIAFPLLRLPSFSSFFPFLFVLFSFSLSPLPSLLLRVAQYLAVVCALRVYFVRDRSQQTALLILYRPDSLFHPSRYSTRRARPHLLLIRPLLFLSDSFLLFASLQKVAIYAYIYNIHSCYLFRGAGNPLSSDASILTSVDFSSSQCIYTSGSHSLPRSCFLILFDELNSLGSVICKRTFVSCVSSDEAAICLWSEVGRTKTYDRLHNTAYSISLNRRSPTRFARRILFWFTDHFCRKWFVFSFELWSPLYFVIFLPRKATVIELLNKENRRSNK